MAHIFIIIAWDDASASKKSAFLVSPSQCCTLKSWESGMGTRLIGFIYIHHMTPTSALFYGSSLIEQGVAVSSLISSERGARRDKTFENDQIIITSSVR